MNDRIQQAGRFAFVHRDGPLQRRHGPVGYVSYQSFKPWLRDEFSFRCVYCLCREQWEPNGDRGFSVEHIRPRATYPDLDCSYENLLYACCTCNSARAKAENCQSTRSAAR